LKKAIREFLSREAATESELTGLQVGVQMTAEARSRGAFRKNMAEHGGSSRVATTGLQLETSGGAATGDAEGDVSEDRLGTSMAGSSLVTKKPRSKNTPNPAPTSPLPSKDNKSLPPRKRVDTTFVPTPAQACMLQIVNMDRDHVRKHQTGLPVSDIIEALDKHSSEEMDALWASKRQTMNREVEEEKTEKLETMNREVEEEKTEKLETMNREVEEEKTEKLETMNREVEEEKTEKLETMNREVGEAIIGNDSSARVEIYWPEDDKWYKGIIKSYDSESGKHCIFYDDGDVENLILAEQTFTHWSSIPAKRSNEGCPAATDEILTLPNGTSIQCCDPCSQVEAMVSFVKASGLQGAVISKTSNKASEAVGGKTGHRSKKELFVAIRLALIARWETAEFAE